MTGKEVIRIVLVNFSLIRRQRRH